MILITWYNTFKIRRSLNEALREIENDTYEMKLWSDRMAILAKDPEGGDYVVSEQKPEQPAEDADGNGFQQLFPEKEAEAEKIPPTEIPLDGKIRLYEQESYFMVYIIRQNFYVIPKKDFSEDEITEMRKLFHLA